MNELQTLYPDSPESLIKLILETQKQGAGLIPCGNGHLVGKFTGPCSKPVALVSSTKMNGILDLDVDNLSVRAQAGVTLAQLQQELDKHNIFLPVSVESHGRRTLGGLVAENAGGYEAYRYGTIQEQILGLEFVTPYGTLVKTGGKTVKNVSGYDTTRLFSGSWGTLGFITSVTFKLRPKVESNAVLLLELPDLREAYRLAEKIKTAKLSLTSLQLFKTGQGSPWKLVINLSGFQESVEQHLRKAGELINSPKLQVATEAGDYWRHYYELVRPEETTLLHIKGSKTVIWQMAETVTKLVEETNPAFWEIDLGTGTMAAAPAQEDNRQELQQAIITATERMGLSYDWVKPPADPLYQKLKASLDPFRVMFPCHPWFGGDHLD